MALTSAALANPFDDLIGIRSESILEYDASTGSLELKSERFGNTRNIPFVDADRILTVRIANARFGAQYRIETSEGIVARTSEIRGLNEAIDLFTAMAVPFASTLPRDIVAPPDKGGAPTMDILVDEDGNPRRLWTLTEVRKVRFAIAREMAALTAEVNDIGLDVTDYTGATIRGSNFQELSDLKGVEDIDPEQSLSARVYNFTTRLPAGAPSLRDLIDFVNDANVLLMEAKAIRNVRESPGFLSKRDSLLARIDRATNRASTMQENLDGVHAIVGFVQALVNYKQASIPQEDTARQKKVEVRESYNHKGVEKEERATLPFP